MKRSALKNFTTSLTIALAIILVLGTLFGFAQYQIKSLDLSAQVVQAADYYAPLDTSSNGETFRSKLSDLITKTHTKLTSYDGLRDVFKTSDADPNKSGNIIWFYSGTSVTFNGKFGSTNREHVWPKKGGTAFDGDKERNVGSDAHHLRPAEQNLNSDRGSKQFGEVPTIASNIVPQAGSTSYDNLCYLQGNYFYPGKGYRGATARILMYVETRWGDNYNLNFVIGAGDCKTIGDIETLMKWHYQEPPTAEEIRRNEAVFKIQGNRNPFIDHPEFATKIYCYDGKSYNSSLQAVAEKYDTYTTGGADIESISLSPATTTLSVGQEILLNATIAPANAKRNLTWISSNPNVATIDNTGKVTAVANGTTTITCQSTDNPSIKCTAQITVKSVTAIEVSGTPAKTVYNDGEKFNPAGLRISATYSDNTKGYLENSACQWLDGVTRKTTLSVGTTSVICKIGDLETIITGITVKEATGGSLTIDRSCFTGSGAYAWCTWSSKGVNGKGFIYPGATDKIQMNSKQASQFIFNTTALPASITSITIKMNTGEKDWQILTSATPFAEASGTATGGTSHGTKQATTNATIWNITTSDRYFAINYADSGAAYIDSIVITYGGSAAECEHVYGEWVISKEPTVDAVGEKMHSCTKCGHVETEEIPKLIPEACEHVFGDWSLVTPSTETTTGLMSHTCTKCGETESRIIDKVGTHTVESFKDSVNSVDDKATKEEKLEAITNAIAMFHSLSSSEKSSQDAQVSYLSLLSKLEKLTSGTTQPDEPDEPLVDNKANALSTGEIAGIVVACVVVVSIGVAVMIILLNKKKSTNK